MARTLTATDTPWDPLVGHSRAARTGRRVHVARTTPTGPGGRIVGPGDPYAQTRQILRHIEQSLRQAGAALAHVVRPGIHAVDRSRWEEVGRAHGEVLRDIRPASTRVEGRAPVSPGMLVAIEAEAYVDN